MKITEKEEKLYKEAFDKYVKNLKMPSEEELGMVEFSPEFEENMEALLKGEKPLRVVTPKKVLMKIASVFIVCSLLASVCVVGIFAEPSDKKEHKIKKLIELHNSVIYDTGEATRYYNISYLPEGYIWENPWYYGGSGPWKNEQGEMIDLIDKDYHSEYQFYDSLEHGDDLLLPEIDLSADIYEKIDGGLYISNSYTGFSRYIWSANGYVFELRADNCSKEEILKMKKSLKIT